MTAKLHRVLTSLPPQLVYLVHCNRRNESESVTVFNWDELVSTLNNHGWKLGSDIKGEYYHLCPCCVEDELRKEFQL